MVGLAEKVAKASKYKVPIGTLLVADELILPQDLDFALEHQRYCRLPLGEILVRMGAVEPEDLERTLKLQRIISIF